MGDGRRGQDPTAFACHSQPRASSGGAQLQKDNLLGPPSSRPVRPGLASVASTTVVRGAAVWARGKPVVTCGGNEKSLRAEVHPEWREDFIGPRWERKGMCSFIDAFFYKHLWSPTVC